jgi:hypothetical protein
LFSLEDLQSAELKGKFYKEQLRLAPYVSDKDFIFEIETVLKTKTVKGKKFLLVKYLYYPGKKSN